ncbi:MAG: hypothetical protein V7K97_22795 [Nostoc sp.]|uniref:hypothetical protein n=1 Tax=Nostoc sp. TaxID=1180 RepID=UPI002FF7D964
MVYTSTGEIVIWGENNAKGKQRSWSGIPLEGFKLVDPKYGQASVNRGRKSRFEGVKLDNLFLGVPLRITTRKKISKISGAHA